MIFNNLTEHDEQLKARPGQVPSCYFLPKCWKTFVEKVLKRIAQKIKITSNAATMSF
jgi:hypothetical protein